MMAEYSARNAGISKRKMYHLAEELKSLCYLNGKERNPKLSAKVIHKLGLVYHQIAEESSNGREQKISLIRSAVLLNAAIVRKPDNVAEVKKDLGNLCAHIIRLTGSKVTTEKIGEFVKKCVKQMHEHRHWVNAIGLEVLSRSQSDMKRVQLTEQLQNIISERYTLLMANVMEFCIVAKGPAPCKYTLVGMGSLAKKEITPYSDFEHIILLEDGIQSLAQYEDILEYFRWVSVLFQVIVVNFGETIIPHVSLPYINDPEENDGKGWFFDAYTPRGVSFDGMVPFACKFPLGRSATPNKPWDTELIKPVSEMLKYLEEEEALKNGYHLANTLTTLCYVCGDKATYMQMKQRKSEILKKPLSMLSLYAQTREDLENFQTRRCLYQMAKEFINIKQVIFRSATLFISALGRMRNCASASSFKVLKELSTNRITQEQFKNFSFALAFACEVRLRIYLKYSSQFDYIDSRQEGMLFADLISGMVEEIKIVYFFTCVFGLQQLFLDSTESHSFIIIPVALFSLGRYESALNTTINLHSCFINDSKSLLILYSIRGHCLLQMNQYKGALECFKCALAEADEANPDRWLVLYNLGFSYILLNMHSNAIECWEKALEYSVPKSDLEDLQVKLFNCYLDQNKLCEAEELLDSIKKIQSTDALNSLCTYFSDRGDLHECKVYAEKLLDQWQKKAVKEGLDHHTAREMLNISGLYLKIKDFATAEKYLLTAESILEVNSCFLSEVYRSLPSECKARRAEIAYQNRNYHLAKDLYHDALTLLPKNDRFTERRKLNLARWHHVKALIHVINNDCEKALEEFNLYVSAMDSHQEFKNSQFKAEALLGLGNCLNVLKRHKKANDILQTNVDMLLNFRKCTARDNCLGECFSKLIDCNFCLGKPQNVVQHYEQGQQYLYNSDIHPELFLYVGLAYHSLGKMENAKKLINLAFKLYSMWERKKTES